LSILLLQIFHGSVSSKSSNAYRFLKIKYDSFGQTHFRD